MSMLFDISICGNQQEDVEMALEEVLRLIREGYHAGSNSNDEGDYRFTSSGEWTYQPKRRQE